MTSTTSESIDDLNPALAAVRSLLAVINDRDVGALDGLLTADFVDHEAPGPVPPGPDGYRRTLGFVTEVLGIRYEVCEEIVTPDRVVVRARAHGCGVAALHGVAAAGRPYAMDTIHVFRTEGPLIAEHWGVRDELGVLVQLGVVPPPEVPAPRPAT